MSGSSQRSAAMERLCEAALRRGASGAKAVPAAGIRTEQRLADMCLEPRCENYGLSASCPPRVKGPGAFGELLTHCSHGLVVKLEVPSEILLSAQRREVFQVLHELVAHLESEAMAVGFDHAHAFAGGSCKNLFCDDLPDCQVLGGQTCRHPDRARPSMSGYGVDVTALAAAAGWELDPVRMNPEAGNSPMGLVIGLVLVG